MDSGRGLVLWITGFGGALLIYTAIKKPNGSANPLKFASSQLNADTATTVTTSPASTASSQYTTNGTATA